MIYVLDFAFRKKPFIVSRPVALRRNHLRRAGSQVRTQYWGRDGNTYHRQEHCEGTRQDEFHH